MEAEETFDLESRSLCPDGACTGLLGPDGRCKTCGAQGEAPAPSRGGHAPPVEEATAPAAPASAAPGAGEGPDAEWDDRRLCPDGACTGLLGPDGRCKVCGRSVE